MQFLSTQLNVSQESNFQQFPMLQNILINSCIAIHRNIEEQIYKLQEMNPHFHNLKE
jgi:hypothetical protein